MPSRPVPGVELGADAGFELAEGHGQRAGAPGGALEAAVGIVEPELEDRLLRCGRGDRHVEVEIPAARGQAHRLLPLPLDAVAADRARDAELAGEGGNAGGEGEDSGVGEADGVGGHAEIVGRLDGREDVPPDRIGQPAGRGVAELEAAVCLADDDGFAALRAEGG